ncbi:MAG: NUDIX hydrolase [Dehalococcoidia bacterium]|nr:NUDIX hydrolase [Dehalococcoidia bacterium]MDW8119241.1 NUDIX hydrolase [Chloroflexota bacterium]
MTIERILESQRIYNGRVVSLRVDTVRLEPKGTRAMREVVEHAPGITIVPVDAQGSVILVRQFRTPAQQVLLECPAGTMEPGETPEQAVHRELLEETGYRAQSLVRLGGFWMSPGFCTEYMHAYLALGLEPGPAQQEADEDIQVERAPVDRIPDLVRTGQVQDAKSIAALLLAYYLHREWLQR